MNPIKLLKQYTVLLFSDCTYIIYNHKFVKFPNGPQYVRIPF